MTDTIVIGAGLAGLGAALRLAQGGQTVTLLTHGLGGLQLGQGTIDVLGYDDQPVDRPFDALPAFVAGHPDHPYARFTPSQVKAAVDWLAELIPDQLVAGDGANHPVPTALGAMRPTYLVQPSMVWPHPTTVAVVGPRQLRDFYPTLVAANLERTAGVTATAYHIDLPARPGEADSAPVVYATALDDPAFLKRFAGLTAKVIGKEDAVLLPGVLGHRTNACARLAEALGRPVVEAHLAPPSIPGLRLNEALTALATSLRVRVILGSKVTGFEAAGGRVAAVTLHQAGRDQVYAADQFVYAPGGFESGALELDSYGHVTEALFGLPVLGADREDLITGDFWADQALFATGVGVDAAMRPLAGATPAYDNLYVAGGLLAGAVRWTEKSGDGIAVTSAVAAADAILRGE
ncbi:MAG: glycerol-3-phosphate dehydrogenase subunit GlpB [Propionibacteriaceae bacterium]|jgi:glycerol-3-phosphate dehydrogenase subunit B|nr:glycerol-3-phosphate dehydrogenase subunit GlpB [Propionibacteriaceae bacterium]